MKDRRAFTLIEMLVVVGIIGLLALVSIPAMNSMLNSNNLTRAGQTICDQIGVARQYASANNRAVEIRLIRMNVADSGYSALLLWSNDVPISRLIRLPDNIVISNDLLSLSQIFANSQEKNISEPNAGLAIGKPYVSLQIRPSGLVIPTLDMNRSFITLIHTRDTGKTFANLRDYVTVQINPNTGTPLVFRP